MTIKHTLKNTANNLKGFVEKHKQSRLYKAERKITKFEKPWFKHFPAAQSYMKATRAYFTWGQTLSKIGMLALAVSFFKAIPLVFVTGMSIMVFMMVWTVVMLLWEQRLKAMNRKREQYMDVNAQYQAATGEMDTTCATQPSHHQDNHSGLSLSMSEKEGLHIEDVVADIFGIHKNKEHTSERENEIEK